jgi:hypothetical protein
MGLLILNGQVHSVIAVNDSFLERDGTPLTPAQVLSRSANACHQYIPYRQLRSSLSLVFIQFHPAALCT